MGETTEEYTEKHTEGQTNYALNTILYGPPGTGKTYNTIKMAAEIIRGKKVDDYDKAQEIFKKAQEDGQLAFITFHQNYSYEDFIQGIKPKVSEDGQSEQLSFSREDGVFKKIANRAEKNLIDSKKDDDDLKKEYEVKQKIINFLVGAIEEEKSLKTKLGTIYHIINYDKKSIAIEIPENKVSRNITLNIEMLESLLKIKSDYKIKNAIDVTKFFEREKGYQYDSYYFALYKEIDELKFKNTAPNIKSIIRQNFVIIIDEINRANISRVFGELITLIEPEKRLGGKFPLSATLPSGEKFIVTDNLYIIGTMNTADKSIALVDIALRRRFEFIAMYPDYKVVGLKEVGFLEALNKKILSDKGADFQIGHSYFMSDSKDANNTWLKNTLNKKVIPLLMEYYRNNIDEVKNLLQSVLNNSEIKSSIKLRIKNTEGIPPEVEEAISSTELS